jgi:hypothetical protein
MQSCTKCGVILLFLSRLVRVSWICELLLGDSGGSNGVVAAWMYAAILEQAEDRIG